MSGDYKYEMQMIAEELAEEEFGRDFYSLDDETQHRIFRKAEGNWADTQMRRADLLWDAHANNKGKWRKV